MRTPMEQGQSLVMTTQRHRSRTTMQCPWRRVFIARLAPSRASNSGLYVRCLLATRTANAINSHSYSTRIQHLSQWLVTNPTRLQARRHLASRSWLVQGRPFRLLQERLQEFLVASPHLRFVEGGLLHPVKHVTVAATHTRQPQAPTAPHRKKRSSPIAVIATKRRIKGVIREVEGIHKAKRVVNQLLQQTSHALPRPRCLLWRQVTVFHELAEVLLQVE